MKKIIMFMLLFTLSLGYSLFAQKTITGTVYDNSSLGIPGVTIVEKGTTNGAISSTSSCRRLYDLCN